MQHCLPGCQSQLLPQEGVDGAVGKLGLQHDLLDNQLQLLGQEYPEGTLLPVLPRETHDPSACHQKPVPQVVADGVLDLQDQVRMFQL